MQAMEHQTPPHPMAAKLGFAPGMILRACGMRRSGNHAIADWLRRNSPTGTSVFLNNCVAGKRPLSNFRTLELNGTQIAAKPAMKDLAGSVGSAGDGALLLFTYEDQVPGRGGRALSGPFDESLLDHDLIFYRSFLNWSASLLKKLQANPGFTATRRAAIVLRAFTTYGALLDRLDGQATGICYDDWLTSEPYRAGILSRLGLPLRDNTLGSVQPYGGGSSFQKDAATPADLAATSRWKQMAADPEYRAILQIAAQDTDLTARLTRTFPQDAEMLAEMTAPNSPGGLS